MRPRLSAHPLASFALGLGALACLGMWSGCKNKDYPACEKDRQCEKGETCVEGICQNCVADTDCVAKGPEGEDWVCHEHRCTDPTLVSDSNVSPGEEGSPCTSSIECVGGLVCLEGKCSGCTEDGQCANGQCNLETNRCAADGSCEDDSQCPEGEICDGGMCIFVDTGGQTGVCGIDAVFFAFDSPVLTPSTQEALKTAAECMVGQDGTVTLEAHADNRGTEDYNIHLTDKRGQSVKSFLESMGVPADKMTVVGKGALEAQGADEASRAKDRRVQFIWQIP